MASGYNYEDIININNNPNDFLNLILPALIYD